jgi:Leucine-rich repeat (LRR) protein
MKNISKNSFNALLNLTYLDLSYNKLSSSDIQSVLQIENLKILNISGNSNIDLTEMKSVLQNIKHLYGLGLADFPTLPSDFFQHLHHLHYLNISGIDMKNESLLFIKHLTSLKSLDISRNSIRSFDNEIVKFLVNIDDVIIQENFLVCDICSIGALLDHIEELKWTKIPKCSYPPQFRGKQLDRLDKESLDQCYDFIPENDVTLEYAIRNFPYILHESQLNILAIVAATTFVLILIILVISISICTHQTAHYYTKEDGKKGKMRIACKSNKILI